MPFRFSKHYTLEEARALLPQVRSWLDRLSVLHDRIRVQEEQLQQMMAIGDDLGGDLVNRTVRMLADAKLLLHEFERRQIQIKDIDRGLVDFPAIRQGTEVFLCWEKDEDDIEYWHDLASGFSGREKL